MAEKIKTMQADQHPIGSIYQSVLPTDPSELFGGTWQMLKDVFLMAAGDSYPAGSTGGEAEHVLTVEEMPNHSHAVKIIYSSGADDGTNWISIPNEKGNPNNMSNVGYTSWVGGSQPHNNMPPYLAVYTWVRIA